MVTAGEGMACARLAVERQAWRKSHPHGFVARPETRTDGSVNLMVWNCVVPGKEGTDWEGGYFPLTLSFNKDYPSSPPVCKFPAGFLHVNVYHTGEVCMSILGGAWSPSITVRQVLLSVQDMLDNPNPESPAQQCVCRLFTKNMPEYKNRVRQQAQRYRLLA